MTRDTQHAGQAVARTLTVPSAPPGSPVPVGADAPIMDVLRTMRAMRRLKPNPVPRELLEQLVEAATWAPSGGNQQRYSYVVVTDRAQMARLGVLWRDVQSKYLTVAERLDAEAFADPAAAPLLDAIRYQAEHFDETPAVIAACYARAPAPHDPRLFADLIRAVGPRFLRRLASSRAATVVGASSSYPGAQNLLLAARALGLAANITAWHFMAENEFKQVLGVPKHVTIYALIPVGWPEGRFGPVRRRPVADVLHWDRW
jgi:nitroreductase